VLKNSRFRKIAEILGNNPYCLSFGISEFVRRADKDVILKVGSRSGAVSLRFRLPGAPRFLWEWTH